MAQEKMLSTGCGEYTMISHLGLATKRFITCNTARAFFSRTLALWRSLVERMRFPITSSMSRASLCCCCTVRPRALSSAGTETLGQSAAERKAR